MSINDTREISIDEILLDELNPRLPNSVGRSQNEMLIYITKNTSITEIMSAIAANGYFPGEPLVVVEKPKGKYTVVEGNRRLTALKLLTDPTLYPKNKKITLIADEAEHRPTKVPCVVFDSRNDVINYLGYRHITGVKQWEPLAKARYIAQYFVEQTSADDDPTDRYQQVARGIGSQGPYIRRQLNGLAIYNLIEDQEFFDIEGLNEESVSFSLITTAVGYEAILKFVSEGEHPFVNPSALIKKNVAKLAEWFFAVDEDGQTTLGDSRNIKKLNHIAADAAAIASLTEGDSLDRAYSKTRGVTEDFSEILSSIEQLLSSAVATVSTLELNDSQQTRIGNIFKNARALKRLSEDD